MEAPIYWLVYDNNGKKQLGSITSVYEYARMDAEANARLGKSVTIAKVLPIAEFKPSFQETIIRDLQSGESKTSLETTS